MDFSKLGQHERTAAIGAAVLVVTGLVAAVTYSIYGMAWLAILAALGLLFVVLQPQIAAGVTLPGSKGSLMLLLGGIAGIVMVLALVLTLGLVFVAFGLADIMFLVAVVAGVVAAWASWQEFQVEGGKFQLGSTTGSGSPETAAPASGAADPAATDPVRDTEGHATTDEPPAEERRTEI